MTINLQESIPNTIKSWDTLPLKLTAAETAAVLGICRESVCDLFSAGTIPVITIGKTRRVSRDALRRWMGE